MVESFIQRKKRAAMKIYFYAAISGISSALLAFGGVFLTLKLLGHALPWYAYLACALVGVVVAGGIVFFGYPTDKRFAKQLDARYDLGEKVQTMVEYDSQESAMLQLQREDAEATVAALPKPKKGVPFWAQVVVLPILAISLFTVSLAVPGNAASKREEPNGPIGGMVEEKYDPTAAIPRLQLVIANVERSKLTEELKPQYLSSLNVLLDVLLKGDLTVSVMKETVRATMDSIFNATTEANTFNAFVTATKGNTELADLRESLRSSRKAHETAQIADRFEMDHTAMQTGVETALQRYVDSMETKLNGAVSTQQEFTACIRLHADNLSALLEADGIKALPAEDGIKTSIVALRDLMEEQIEKLNDPMSGVVVSGAVTTIKEGAETFASMEGCVEILCHQAHSFMMKEYVMEQLEAIFGVAAPREEEGDSTEAWNPGNGGGDVGTGGLNFPGNGVVLDIDDIAYVKYYLLLGEYRGKYDDWITDPENEQLSPELKKYIEAYFQGLTNKGDQENPAQ